MKYIVISASSIEKLQSQVNQAMKEGFILQGGVSIAIDQGNYQYCQAMVKQL